MSRHVGLWVNENAQALGMGYHICDIAGTVMVRAMAVLGTRMGQATISWEVQGEAFRIVDVPMEYVEVVLLEHVQQVQDRRDREKLSPRVEHKASVRVLVGSHPCTGFEGDRPRIATRVGGKDRANRSG